MTSYLVKVRPSVLDAAKKDREWRGNVWRTDRFASTSPILRGLGEDGSLFLVTVSILGFVSLLAVIERPTFQKNAWVSAKKNTVPSRYVTMRNLSIARSQSWSTLRRQLKRMLYTPQPLTDEDVVEILGAPLGVDLDGLRVVSSTRPKSIADLDATQKKQLRQAGRGHDGKDLPAASRLAPRPKGREPDPDESFAGLLEILQVADRTGKVLYDVFVCGPDSGSVFRTRTTKTVAELIQGGLQCRDSAMAERLRRALAKKGAKKRNARKGSS
jgi:hypothetical protein